MIRFQDMIFFSDLSKFFCVCIPRLNWEFIFNTNILTIYSTENNMGVIHHLPSSSESMQHQQSVTPPSEIYESKMRVTDLVAALKVEKNSDGHYLCSECKKSFSRLDSFKQVSFSCPGISFKSFQFCMHYGGLYFKYLGIF